MTAAAASIIELLLGGGLAPAGRDPSNRFTLEGLTFGAGKDGTLEVGIRRFEATSFRMAFGPFTLEIGLLALHKVVAVVQVEAGAPRLRGLQAEGAELTGVKVQGPLVLPGHAPGHTPAAPAAPTTPAPGSSSAGAAGPGSWSLAPLASAEGKIRAEIVDAHLLFDADVTVPVRQGQVDFNEATVEHVGPDSRMGVSRLGLYVDAPNGRSYLYQFTSAPVAGVEFEQRGALLGPRVTNRGRLRLQPFGEGLMRQPARGPGQGLTDQARQLFDRTAVSGEVQLGDGLFAARGLQAELAGRGGGRNLVRLQSASVGRGLTVEMASLSVRKAVLAAGGARLDCGEISGMLTLRLFVENAQLRFTFDLTKLKLSNLRLQLQRPKSV
jgi:hypothetical protein